MWRATCRKVSRQACAKDFNPRPPWGGRRQACRQQSWLQLFQSTPSVGRATPRSNGNLSFIWNFNPRPPWGGRHTRRPSVYEWSCISIHALRGEGDNICNVTNSTVTISIHALRGEGDEFVTTECRGLFDFNPRPPWGGRREAEEQEALFCISIHALRGEGDDIARTAARKWKNFNPRPPWGGRHPNSEQKSS